MLYNPAEDTKEEVFFYFATALKFIIWADLIGCKLYSAWFNICKATVQ